MSININIYIYIFSSNCCYGGRRAPELHGHVAPSGPDLWANGGNVVTHHFYFPILTTGPKHVYRQIAGICEKEKAFCFLSACIELPAASTALQRGTTSERRIMRTFTIVAMGHEKSVQVPPGWTRRVDK